MEKDEALKRLEQLQSQVNHINFEIQEIKRSLGTPQRYAYSQPVQKPEKKISKNLENNIGKNLMGILASLLIFFGITSLGVLIYKEIPEIARFVFMFLISFAFFGTGLFLNLKKSGTFAKSVLSCGIGAVYISLFLTHFYFLYISELTLFMLLLVWSVITFALHFILKSELFAIISYIGFGISLLLGSLSTYGETPLVFEALIALLVVYSFVILSRTLEKRTRIILTSMFFALTFILSAVGLSQLSDNFDNGKLLYLVCIVLTTALSFFLLKKIIEMDKNSFLVPVFTTVSVIGDVSIASVLGLSLNGYVKPILCSLVSCNEVSKSTTFLGLMILAILISLFSFLMYIKIKMGYVRKNRTMLYILSVFISIMFISNGYLKVLGLLSGTMIFGIIMMFLFVLLKDRVLLETSLLMSFTGMLGVSVNFNVGFLYSHLYVFLTFAVLTVFYILMSASMLCEGTSGPLHFINSLFGLGIVFEPIFTYVTARVLNIYEVQGDLIVKITENRMSMLVPSFAVFALYFAFMLFVRYSKFYGEERFIQIVLKVVCLFLTCCGIVLLYNLDVCEPLRFLTLLITFSVWFINARDLLKLQSVIITVYTAIKTTLFMNLVMYSYLHNYEEISYIYSLACIVLAVLFIVAGFKFKLKAFRLYGLSLAIACVLKLVLIDISYTSSIAQVISFIISGLLCFGIVGIYNIAQAHFENQDAKS